MNRFYIITNDGKDADFEVTMRIKNYIEKHGCVCILAQKDEHLQIIKDTVPKQCDCAIVIGGDGTLIQAARELLEYHIPLLGVNMGTLGYLTEVEVHHVEQAVSRLMEGEFSVEDRMMLCGVLPDGKKDLSLNDIVVTRLGSLRVIHFNIYVNEELLNSYQADGVIISTPTGSTAYNLSAGGPIVEPTAEMIVITPICSHALNTSSIVLSAGDRLIIEIGEGRNECTEHAVVSFDGKDSMNVQTGDRIYVERAKYTTKLIKLSKVSFLETLREKMKGN